MIEVKNLDYTYPCGHGLKKLSITIRPGEFVGLIGPNGSGKSTFLKNLYRELEPDEGSIVLAQKELSTYSYRETALLMGVLSQHHECTYDYTVYEMVEMGRTPYRESSHDPVRNAKIEFALKQVGIESLCDKSFSALSGGEKQRVLLARAIAQDTPILLLDEPTNHLDIYYQIQVFQLVKALGKTVIAAIHDLNIASMYCDRLYVMNEGKIVQEGSVEEVITQEMIQKIFHVPSLIVPHPQTKKPAVIYLEERENV